MSIGLYIHIPFCRRICPYCSFSVTTGRSEFIDRYLDALEMEMKIKSEKLCIGRVFDTVYIGGGTPTVLSVEQLKGVLRSVYKYWRWVDNAEITLEANPGTLDIDKLRDIRDLGINRISLGVQSFNDRVLKALYRDHTSDETVEAFNLARKAGFENINIDLIFGAPGGDLRSWEEDLDVALDLAPEHMSIYGLTIEPGTPFDRMYKRGRLNLPTEETQGQMYNIAMERLEDRGYEHYEISNFSKTGFQSRHNQSYWDGSEYVGVGTSAHSFWDGRRFWNVFETSDYVDRLEKGMDVLEDEEVLSEGERICESIFLGLRTGEGIDLKGFYERHSFDYREKARKCLGPLIEKRLIEDSGGSIRLTQSGFMVADSVIEELAAAVEES